MRTWVVLASLWLLAAPLSAQVSDDERARTHFEAGRSYYEQARYDDAVREFDQAFALSGRAALLLNLSQAHERGLHFTEAIADIDRYLSLVPDSPDRKTLEERKQHLEELRARIAAPQPTAAPVAPAAAEPVAATPPPALAPVQPEPPAATSTPTSASNPFEVPGWVLIGTGGAALVGSLVTGLMASSKHSDLEQACPKGVCAASEQDTIDSAQTLAVVSTILLAVGVVAGGVGTTFLFLGDDDAGATEHAGLRLRVTAGPTPLGAGAHLTF
jgi:tetratricopeptide (TPR) repeat protein